MSGLLPSRSPKSLILTSLRRRSRIVRHDTLQATNSANWTWMPGQPAAFADKGCLGPQPPST